MTENTEAVVCTEPLRERSEMALREDNHGPVGEGRGGGVRFLVNRLRGFMCLPRFRQPQDAPRLPTEHQNTEDRSTLHLTDQSNSERKTAGPVKRKMSKCQSSNECDSLESERSQQDAYIQIPLSVMSGNVSTSYTNQLIFNEDESPSSPVEGQNVYKLIEGFPSCAEIRKRKSYVMSYNTKTKNAEWVYEILNGSTLENKCKEHMSFGRNELENTDYQQGHLAAAANHRWCQEAYHDTYLMSNMIPQLSDLNKGMWKTLEKICRNLAKPGCNVHVYTGPLYLCKKEGDYVPKNLINSEEKAVPTHIFKVIIVEKNGRVEEPKCYVMPNRKSEYKKFSDSAENYSTTTKNNLEVEEMNLELYNDKEISIEQIQIWSGLKFKIDKPQDNTIDHTETITWKGEDEKGESCEAKIEVKILNKILILKQKRKNSSRNPHSDNKDTNV